MVKERIFIVGVASNVSRFLHDHVERLNQVLKNHLIVGWYIVESDSTDSTVATLEYLSHTISGFEYVSLGLLKNQIPNRTERLAHVRNCYLEYVRLNAESFGITRVLVIDLDDINFLLSTENFDSALQLQGVDAFFPNQLGPYYDIYALRHHVWSPVNFEDELRFLSKFIPAYKLILFHPGLNRMITIPSDHPKIKVESAFGGLGCYKIVAFLSGSYVGTSSEGNSVCEHVTFHKMLHKYDLYILPFLINARTNEHSELYYLPNRIWHFLKKKIYGAFQIKEVRTGANHLI